MTEEVMQSGEKKKTPVKKNRSFAVIGLGMFGQTMAKMLAEGGAEVLAIDKNEKLVQEISNDVSSAVAFDCTDEILLKAHGLANIDVVIVAIGEDFGSTVITTRILKNMQNEKDSSSNNKVYSRAATKHEEKILRAIGADHIYTPEKTQAESEARKLTMHDVHSFVTLVGDICVAATGVKEGMLGKTIRETNFREIYSLNIAYIGRRSDGDGKMKYRLPRPDDKFKEDDQIFVIGDVEEIEDYINS